jgi:hypothetical protein
MVGGDAGPKSDLQALVHSHCVFFDKLVELVPPKFYVPSEGSNDTWIHGMNKAARAAARQATKENLKKAKRVRLDPDKFATTLQVLQQQEKHDEHAVQPAGNQGKAENRTVTYEELRERLHKRLELLRAKRHADAAKTAREWQTEKKQDAQKRSLKRKAKEDPIAMDTPPTKLQRPATMPESQEAKMQLEFGRVKMGISPLASHGREKHRKESKEQLLAKATELQKDMQDPEKGQEIATKHLWSASLSRAAGEKVLDNPKLLKRSLRREEQQRQKSSKKWKERKAIESKTHQTKQQMRRENITQRQDAKKERQIAKREKKLLRPGFEGRKEGFINT